MKKLLLILLLIIQPVSAEVLNGRVVGVSDGDTVTLLLPDMQQVRVRLTEIDAPEKGQPYGNAARQALAEMVHQKDVRVSTRSQDRYGRVLGRIYVGDLDVNRQMVRDGAAWVYRQYMTDRSLLAEEQAAKDARRGLWALQEDQRIPPWEWRRGVRTVAAPANQQQDAP